MSDGLAAAASIGMITNPGAEALGNAVRLRLSVDTERFAPGDREAARQALKIDPNRPVLLTVGRLNLGDGHLTMLQALPEVQRATSTRPLYVIGGEGDDADRIASCARYLGLEEDVVLAGPVPPRSLSRLFSAADLFVLLGRETPHEPFRSCATVVVEAAACALPSVATRAGPLPGLIDEGVTGLLVDETDTRNLVAVIGGLCGDPARCTALGAAARDRAVTEHSLPGLARDLETLYLSTLDDSPVLYKPRSIAPLSRTGRIVVMMPTLGCRPWLQRAIECVLGQDWPQVDLFVVDDAGDDLDATLLSMFPTVTFLRMRQRTGPYGIANQLLALTDSEYIAFHDADDWSTPDRFSTQVAYLEREGFEGCGSWARLVDLNGDPLGFETYPLHASLAMRLRCSDELLHPSSLLRRRLFDKLHGFDDSTRIGGDTEFHLRAALFCELGNVQRFLYTRLVRPDSLTQDNATSFGSQARLGYINPITAAFNEIVDSKRSMPEPGLTLGGRQVSTPVTEHIAWWRKGVASPSVRREYATAIPEWPHH
jgi:hypothetical protein